MIDANETFDGTWPFAPHFHREPARAGAAPFRMHYVDEGPRDAAPIVCLHGEPTWGYLYRNMIPRLAERHRVLVPDHMGFGKSDTPQDRPYTLRTHVENLTSWIETLDLRDLTFVLQDWGGPMGVQFTVRHPERVRRLFLANTIAGYGAAGRKDLPRLQDSRWFRWIGGGLDNGRTEAVLRHLGSTVLSVMKIIGFEHTGAVNDTWIRAYSAPFTTPDECIGAIEFPLDAYHQRIRDFVIEGAAGVDALKAKPAMLAEGMCDHAIPPEFAIADFQGVWPDRPVVRLPGVGHFCQEDAPDTLVALIEQFVQGT
ncbi:MAG TPA: alpha/beta fold hydrolase [Candidatus Kryptonia bacterium]|nr:alpha/beta fold hydrolase [Candidatus Kryptonia bacterium]